eukprot:gene27216-32882_t
MSVEVYEVNLHLKNVEKMSYDNGEVTREVSEIPSLMDLCIDTLMSKVKPKDVEQMFSICCRVDLNHEKMGRLKTFVIKNIRDLFPFIMERYHREEVESVLEPELFNSLYKAYEDNIKAKRQFASLKGTIIEPASVSFVENSDFYPISALVQGVKWPANVPADSRENFLSPDDFLKVFGMTKEEFKEQPRFVRIRMKKEKSLF